MDVARIADWINKKKFSQQCRTVYLYRFSWVEVEIVTTSYLWCFPKRDVGLFWLALVFSPRHDLVIILWSWKITIFVFVSYNAVRRNYIYSASILKKGQRWAAHMSVISNFMIVLQCLEETTHKNIIILNDL